MEPNGFMADALAPFSDGEIAVPLKLKWWRQVALWRRGLAFPQKRHWSTLSILVRRDIKDIAAAYKEYRNGR